MNPPSPDPWSRRANANSASLGDDPRRGGAFQTPRPQHPLQPDDSGGRHRRRRRFHLRLCGRTTVTDASHPNRRRRRRCRRSCQGKGRPGDEGAVEGQPAGDQRHHLEETLRGLDKVGTIWSIRLSPLPLPSKWACVYVVALMVAFLFGDGCPMCYVWIGSQVL